MTNRLTQPTMSTDNLRVTDLNAGDVLTLGNEPVEVKTVVINDPDNRTYIEYTHQNTGCTACDDDIGGTLYHRLHATSVRRWSEHGYLERISGDNDE